MAKRRGVLLFSICILATIIGCGPTHITLWASGQGYTDNHIAIMRQACKDWTSFTSGSATCSVVTEPELGALTVVFSGSGDPIITEHQDDYALGAYTVHGEGIVYAMDRMNSDQEFYNLTLHELGHLFGYNHVGETCEAVMAPRGCAERLKFGQLDLMQCAALGQCPALEWTTK